MVHPRGLWLTALLALMVLSTPAQAQLPSEFLAIEVSATSESIERDGLLGTFTVVVSNPTQSPFPADVTLNVSQAPEGWSANLAETTFQLAGGQSADTILTLEAAEDAEITDIEVTLTAVARYTSPLPGAPSSPPAQDQFVVEYGFERGFLAGLEQDLGVPFWALLIAVLLAAALIVFLFIRKPAALSLDVDAEVLQVPAGSMAVVPVRVHNPGGRRTTAQLEVAGVPDGWEAYIEPETLDVPARQAEVAQLHASVPADAHSAVRELSVLASHGADKEVRAVVTMEVRGMAPPTPAVVPVAPPEPAVPKPAPAPAPAAAPEPEPTPAAAEPAAKPEPVEKPKPAATAKAAPVATAAKAAPRPIAKKAKVAATKPAKAATATKAAAPKLKATPAATKPAAEPKLEAKATNHSYRDYAGTSRPVEEIEGIGPVYGERLRAAGIQTTARLCYESPENIAKAAKVPATTAAQWQSMIQLTKVKGIGPQYAEALVRAGVQDVASLKRRQPERIASQVTKYLDGLETSVVGTTVSAKRVESWQAAAKSMRKTSQPVPEK